MDLEGIRAADGPAFRIVVAHQPFMLRPHTHPHTRGPYALAVTVQHKQNCLHHRPYVVMNRDECFVHPWCEYEQ